MANKTERILSYLPSTFQPLPRTTALYATADAFGRELLNAENALAAMMGAHWVDHADRAAELIEDLARIASLYGLTPRSDEEVEEFREHLKRYIRTFLEGTVTVQGILRVVAEALALHIADEPASLDAWWKRPTDELITVESSSNDAARLLFGVDSASVKGEPARAASVTGKVDLSRGVELPREASVLNLKVDAKGPVQIRFPESHLNPRLTLKQILDTINQTIEAPVASHEGGHLVLTSPTKGPASRIEVVDIAGDAALRLLGMPPHTYRGKVPDRAQVTGMVDLSGGVNLSHDHYLRLMVDGHYLAEINCAGENAEETKLSEIVAAINKALGVDVAFNEDGFLKIVSPTIGFASSIQFQRAAAQDARERLFGPVASFHTGHDALPAEAVGVNNLRLGVDLSVRSLVRIFLDDQPPITIDCAGESENPGNTQLDEIVRALNNNLGPVVASHDGHFVHVASPTAGPESFVTFEPLPVNEDAAELIFGIVPRSFSGAAARRARLTGLPDLSAGVNIGALNVFQVALDGGPFVKVDLSSIATGTGPAMLDDLVATINNTLGPAVASHDEQHLSLASPTKGPTSSLALEPLTRTRRRRFVTRAFTTDEASQKLFGFFSGEAHGTDAAKARVTGKADLSRGVDLREAYFLRLALDDRPAIDIDCRGVRPRATLLGEVVAAINQRMAFKVATPSVDETSLVLTSPTTGVNSRIAFEPPRASDASVVLFGHEPGNFRGSDATRVVFVGTADLSGGIDLAAEAQIRLSIDGSPFYDIFCSCESTTPSSPAGPAPSTGTPPGGSGHDHDMSGHGDSTPQPPDEGHKHTHSEEPTHSHGDVPHTHGTSEPHIHSNDLSHSHGDTSAEHHVGDTHSHADVPTDSSAGGHKHSSSPDHTHSHGSEEPHTHDEGPTHSHGDVNDHSHGGGTPPPSSPPPLVPPHSHHGGGGGGGGGPRLTTITDIIIAINVTFGAFVATQSDDGRHIVLTSRKTGSNSKIDFAVPSGLDATKAIFGITGPRSYHGVDATPAQILGACCILDGIDLTVTRFLRIGVNGGPPVDIDVAARALNPASVKVNEILASINEWLTAAKVPVTADVDKSCDCLVLITTTNGSTSRIDLPPFEDRDARFPLLGDVPAETTGAGPAPATIKGEPDLLRPINLLERRTLKISVDGGRPVDVDVSGFVPEMTQLGEVISRLNAVFPSLASATPDDRLLLTSPTRGANSSLKVLPTRALEVIEYPARPSVHPPEDTPPLIIRHGDRWSVNNEGAADADLLIELRAPQGAVGPEFVNRTTNERIRLLSVIRPGETAQMWRDPQGGIHAAIIAEDGTRHPVPDWRIFAGPLGNRANIPFDGEWSLSDGDDTHPAMLQLNNSFASNVVILRSRKPGNAGNTITVSVTEAQLIQPGESGMDVGAHAGSMTGRLHSVANGFRLLDDAGVVLAVLRGGAGISLESHLNRVVNVRGTIHPADNAPPLIIVDRVADLFDVTMRFQQGDDAPQEETYTGVTIGLGEDAPDSLVRQINRGATSSDEPSQLVRADERSKADALILVRGLTRWTYLDCFGARLDDAVFRNPSRFSRFAGGRCINRAMFNVNRFARQRPEPTEAVVFAAAGVQADPPVEIRFRWEQHQPGAFQVNLPADLPERFGSRFVSRSQDQPRLSYAEARFGQSKDADEIFEEVSTEPLPSENPDHLVSRVNNGTKRVKGAMVNSKSALVKAVIVKRVPIGFRAVTIPFRKPRQLTRGREGETARLYLREKDVPDFIEVSAREPGAWGNAISVSARKSGPARFDFTVSYRGAIFESARRIALVGALLPEPGGDQLPTSTQDLLRPGPAGVLQAKAAGVRAEVTRDRAQSPD